MLCKNFCPPIMLHFLLIFLYIKGNDYEVTSPISSPDGTAPGNGMQPYHSEKSSLHRPDRNKDPHKHQRRPRTPISPEEMHGKASLVGYPRTPPPSGRGPPRTPEGPPPRDQSASPGTPDMRTFDPHTRIITPEYANSPDKLTHGRRTVSSSSATNRSNLSKRPVTPPDPYPGSPLPRNSLVPNEYGNDGDTDISRSNSPPSMTAMLVANSNYKRPPSPPTPNSSDRMGSG